MSNLQSLPIAKATLGVGIDEDIDFSIGFYANDGVTPLSLAGIAFTCAIGAVAELMTGQGISVSGAGFNILSAFLPAVEKENWSRGVYPLSLIGVDGTYAKNVFAWSSLTIDSSSPFSLQQLRAPMNSATLVAAIPNQVASNTAAISQLLSLVGASSPIVIDSSTLINSAGLYLVTSVGISVTLPDPVTWAGGSITIKDATQSPAPAISIVGTVEFDPGGALIDTALEGLTLMASSVLGSWFIV